MLDVWNRILLGVGDIPSSGAFDFRPCLELFPGNSRPGSWEILKQTLYTSRSLMVKRAGFVIVTLAAWQLKIASSSMDRSW